MSERFSNVRRVADVTKSLANNALGLPLRFFETKTGRMNNVEIVVPELEDLQKEIVTRMRHGGDPIEMVGIGTDEVSRLLRHQQSVISFPEPQEGVYEDGTLQFTIYNRFLSFDQKFGASLAEPSLTLEMLKALQERLKAESDVSSHIVSAEGDLHLFVNHPSTEKDAMTALTPDQKGISFDLVNATAWAGAFFDPIFPERKLRLIDNPNADPNFENFRTKTEAHNTIVGQIIGALHSEFKTPLITDRLELLPVLKR